MLPKARVRIAPLRAVLCEINRVRNAVNRHGAQTPQSGDTGCRCSRQAGARGAQAEALRVPRRPPARPRALPSARAAALLNRPEKPILRDKSPGHLSTIFSLTFLHFWFPEFSRRFHCSLRRRWRRGRCSSCTPCPTRKTTAEAEAAGGGVEEDHGAGAGGGG